MKGLLVDFGGVLTTSVFDSFRAFCADEGIDPEAVRRLFRGDPAALADLRRMEVGELGEAEFEQRLGGWLGIDPSDGLVDRLFSRVGPDEAMVEAVRRARQAGVRTGLVSNSWGTSRYDRGALAELFDGVVISGDVGLHKPQPEIFLLGAERVGLPPAECAFVDDLRENCEAAEALGMAPVLHRDAESTIPELERLLGLSLRE